MFAKNFAQIFPRLHPFDHGLKSVDQLENADFTQTQRRVDSRARRSGARKNSFLFQGARLQLRGRFLELLVFDQLPDQIPARIVFFGIFVRRLLIDRQQAAAFQINQIRRHDDEFARDVDVQFLKSLEIFQGIAA